MRRRQTQRESDERPALAIGGVRVGEPGRVYVIAEAGVNHDGDASTARRLIDAAKESGADAVKFQMFRADRLVAADADTCAYQKDHVAGGGSQRDMLRRLELPDAAWAELKSHADRIGIEFLATPFGEPEVAALDALGVAAIKIASPDIVNVPLLEAAARTGRPLVVSTGAAERHEIDFAVALLRRTREDVGIALLHCVSAYPTDAADANLARIGALARRYHVPVGFSDHTVDAGFGALAVAAGAVILEKHLTLSRSGPGPDHFFSLEPPEMLRYVAGARRAATAMGESAWGPRGAEQEVRRLARGRIVAVSRVPRGKTLSSNDLMVQRPGGGIDPVYWEAVIGRKSLQEIPEGTPLAWSMLE